MKHPTHSNGKEGSLLDTNANDLIRIWSEKIPSMPDQNEDTDRSWTMENLERIIPDARDRETFARILGHLESDQAAMVLLKGHLLIEEILTATIQNFVFHGEHLKNARFSFAQKLALSRSMSLSRAAHSQWNVIAKLNKLRNTLSHSLENEQRTKAMEAVRIAYRNEQDGKLSEDEKSDDAILLTGAVAMSVGFVGAFQREVERSKRYLTVLNQHLHSTSDPV